MTATTSTKIVTKIAMIAMCMAISCGAVRAETVLIKLATVAPAGSTWHEYLQELDAQWRQASGGKVRLQIYAGTLGDEGIGSHRYAVRATGIPAPSPVITPGRGRVSTDGCLA